MRKRTIIAIAIALTLCFGATAFWSAETTERDGDVASNILTDTGSDNGPEVDKKKDGNKIVRVLTSPWRAFKKLFGGGKDDSKPQRLSESDVERFESAAMTRVSDSRNPESKPRAEGTARDHLAQGRALLSMGRVNEAITELSMAISLDSGITEAQSLLGVAYDRKGMHERAKDAYNKAIRSDPEDAQTINNLGYSLYLNGNYRAAVDKLKRAIKLAPTDQRILNNLALAQARLGKYDDAYKNFARAGGEFTGRMNTAALLERMGRDEEAIKHYEAARRIQPNSQAVLQHLSELYRRTGRNRDGNGTQTSIAADAVTKGN